MPENEGYLTKEAPLKEVIGMIVETNLSRTDQKSIMSQMFNLLNARTVFLFFMIKVYAPFLAWDKICPINSQFMLNL